MTHSQLAATLLSLFAACALVFGSAIPSLPFLRSRLLADKLSLLIGFSAGLMLATALHELLPEAMADNPHAVWGAGLGFLTLYAAERMTHFHACRHRDCEIEDDLPQSVTGTPLPLVISQPSGGHHHHHHHHVGGHADIMALVGMSIHNFADGLTMAAAFSVSKTVGIVVVLAIVLHQMAAGLSLGAIMKRVGREQARVWISTAISASFIVWGSVFYNFAVPVQKNSTGIVLGIAAGSFLYVAACDLLPEAHADDEGWAIMATTLFGYAFAVGATMLFGSN